MYLLYFLLFLLLSLLISFITYLTYINFFHPGAVYYPSTDLAVARMLKLAQLSSKDTLVDLGSGDGRILIAAARLKARAIGYEINPLLVWKSRRLIREAKLDNLATVYWKSFWKADFSHASVVTVYLFPHLMNRLQSLLEKKIKHPVRLIANNYPFTKLQPVKHYFQIYLYNFKSEKSKPRT
jgi:ribosomal protein L11 methylase PrmA